MFSLPEQVQAKIFAATRQIHIVNNNILNFGLHSTFWDAGISAATRLYQIQALYTREYNFLNKKNVFLSVKLANNVINITKTQSMMSYNWAKMSYISLKNCPIILYFFRQKSVGTLYKVL